MSTLEIEGLAPMQLINPPAGNGGHQRIFSSSQLSQFMDNENPLSELEHKRRFSSYWTGWFNARASRI